MSSFINPIEPLIIAPAYEQIKIEKSKVSEVQPELQPVESPPVQEVDVTRWVRKLNTRLAPAWQENEIIGGRAVFLDDITANELKELLTLFQGWDLKPCKDSGRIVLIVKPVRMPTKRRG